jgi:hypothetical protein
VLTVNLTSKKRNSLRLVWLASPAYSSKHSGIPLVKALPLDLPLSQQINLKK